MSARAELALAALCAAVAFGLDVAGIVLAVAR